MLRPKWKATLLPATKRWHKTMDTCMGTLSLGQMDFWNWFKKIVNTYVFWHNWQSLNHLWFITLLNLMWPVVLKVWPPTNCISTSGNLSEMQMFESHLKQKFWGGTQQCFNALSTLKFENSCSLCFVEVPTVKLQIYLLQKKSVKTDVVNILKYFEISYT